MASGDHLSGSRFEFGIGAGWNREEMRNHGTDPRQRMQLLAERVEAMKAIWTQHEASYKGMLVLSLPCDPAVLERLAAADDAAADAPVLRAGAGSRGWPTSWSTRRSQSSQTTTTTTGTRCGGAGRR